MDEAPDLPDEDKWADNQYDPDCISNPIDTIIEATGPDIIKKFIITMEHTNIWPVINGEMRPNDEELDIIAKFTGIPLTFWRNRFNNYHTWLESKTNAFLERVKGMQEKDLETIKFIMSEAEDWIENDQIHVLQSVVDDMEIEEFTTDVLITMLTVTKWPERNDEYIDERDEFFKECSELIHKRGDYEEGLFGGLE